MSNNFSKVQRALKNERDLDGSWQLLSISFDTKFDTPKILKEYGTNYGADFSNWDFVVGTDEVTRELARGFDMYIETGDGGLIDHNLRTAILDADGKLVKVIKGNEWTADDIVAEVKKHSRRQAS